MSKTAEIIEHTAIAPSNGAALTPMDMLDRAIVNGAGIETLEKLMALQERWERNQARKDFDGAIAAAKAAIPVIIKDGTAHNQKKYATFAAIAKVIDPILPLHGLHYRFRSTQEDGRISVTCILGHKSGHSEEATLSGPADTSGSKNAIQAIGSTLTYLQRYSLVQMLGLAATEDDDAQAGGSGAVLSDEQADTIRDLVTTTKSNLERFLTYMKAPSISDIPAKHFQRAVDALEAKRAKS